MKSTAIRRLAARALGREDWRVSECPTGDEALAAIAALGEAPERLGVTWLAKPYTMRELVKLVQKPETGRGAGPLPAVPSPLAGEGQDGEAVGRSTR